MALLLILLAGLSHGIQPDHAVTAAALAAQRGLPAWVAALRLALGHCVALLMLAVALDFAPSVFDLRFARVTGIIGAGTLIIVGAALLFRTLRSSAGHVGHHIGPLPLVIGWILGLASTGTVAVLPLMAQSHGALLGVLAYSAGIAAGVAATSAGVDWLRYLTRGRLSRRAVDGTLAVGAVVNGCWLLLAAI